MIFLDTKGTKDLMFQNFSFHFHCKCLKGWVIVLISIASLIVIHNNLYIFYSFRVNGPLPGIFLYHSDILLHLRFHGIGILLRICLEMYTKRKPCSKKSTRAFWCSRQSCLESSTMMWWGSERLWKENWLWSLDHGSGEAENTLVVFPV